VDVVVVVVVVVGTLSDTLTLASTVTGDGMAVVIKVITLNLKVITPILKDHRVITTADPSLIRRDVPRIEAEPPPSLQWWLRESRQSCADNLTCPGESEAEVGKVP
jgi:hypothetical protein